MLIGPFYPNIPTMVTNLIKQWLTLKKDATHSIIKQVQIAQSNSWVTQTSPTGHNANKSNKHAFTITTSRIYVKYPNKSYTTSTYEQIGIKHNLIHWLGNKFIKYNLEP